MARSTAFKRFVGSMFAIFLLVNFYWLWTFSSITLLNPLQLHSSQNAAAYSTFKSQVVKCSEPLIVTTSRFEDFRSLKNLMRSLFVTNSDIKAVVFDMGLREEQIQQVKSWCNTQIMSFPFEKYPTHIRQYNNYDWIPLVISEILSTYNQQCVLFVNPQVELRGSLQTVFAELEHNGYWFTATEGNSPKTTITSDVFGIAKGTFAEEFLIKPWVECSLSQSCYTSNGNRNQGLNEVIYLSLEYALKATEQELAIQNDARYRQDAPDTTTIFYLNPTPQAHSNVTVCGDVNRKLVIMATNQVPKYSFYMPLSALVWKSRFQYESVILLIGSEEKWLNHPPSSVVLKYLKLFGVKQIFFVDVPDNLSVFMSQIARIFAAYLPLQATDDTFMITSDADLWPINKKLYQITDPTKEMLLLNAYCCGDFDHKGKKYTMFPMGHIGMPRKIWKEVMNVKPENLKKKFPDMISAEANALFETITVDNVEHGGDGWYNDQNMISIKIAEWSGYPGKAQKESFSGTRIDRAWWPSSVVGIVNDRTRDAHLLHPGYESWNRVSPLLAQLVTQEEAALAEEYVKEFVASMKKQ